MRLLVNLKVLFCQTDYNCVNTSQKRSIFSHLSQNGRRDDTSKIVAFVFIVENVVTSQSQSKVPLEKSTFTQIRI